MIDPTVALICLTVITLAILVAAVFMLVHREGTFYKFTMHREAMFASERSVWRDEQRSWKDERHELMNRFMAKSLLDFESGKAMEAGTQAPQQVSDEREAEIERAFRKATQGG